MKANLLSVLVSEDSQVAISSRWPYRGAGSSSSARVSPDVARDTLSVFLARIRVDPGEIKNNGTKLIEIHILPRIMSRVVMSSISMNVQGTCCAAVEAENIAIKCRS